VFAVFTPPPEAAPPTAVDLIALLTDLYAREQAVGTNPYLAQHAQPTRVRHHVQTFRWYRPYLPAGGAVLDWGCQHGPDSALIRAAFGDRFELHGCDLVPETAYPRFRAFSGIAYRTITDPVRLPYPDATFDAVIASGVLEHVPMDFESLKEVYRVLRSGGRLVITYLPNWLSVGELRLRRENVWGQFHRRLYGREETATMLKHTGFYPVTPVLYQSFTWEGVLRRMIRSAGLARGLARAIRFVFPAQVFAASTLCCVAEKLEAM
jgi:ubiquinone/menaquinone biosynthesis C-methylase UbiE